MIAPLWQLSVSSQHMVKSLTLNPYMSLCNLKLCTHIWSTNINFRPLHWTFWSVLVWTFTLWVNCGGRVSWAGDIFLVTHGQKRDYLSRAFSQQCARGATKNRTSMSLRISSYRTGNSAFTLGRMSPDKSRHMRLKTSLATLFNGSVYTSHMWSDLSSDIVRYTMRHTECL